MGQNWTGAWVGGRRRTDRHDRPIWVLERMWNGRRYSRTLDVGNEDEALAELALFTRDPEAYVTRAQAAVNAAASQAVMNEDTVGRLLAHLKEEGRTERYRKNIRSYLAQWSEFYADRDLRFVSLQEILRELGRHKKARKIRITALKCFTRFLREVDAVLPLNEDPTLGLKVPAPRPEKARRARLGQKKGYEVKEIERLYAAINGRESRKYGWKGTGRVTDVQCVRDVLCLHAKCGMHGTEIERLALGECDITRLKGQGEIAGTIRFIHKSGRLHIVSLDEQGMAAAERLRARGSAPVDSHVRKVLAEACESIGLDLVVNLGALRHSFTTWAKRDGRVVQRVVGGAPLASIAAVLGHQSTRTTSLYYDGTEVPDMIALPIKLVHPEDPVRLHRQPKDRVGNPA